MKNQIEELEELDRLKDDFLNNTTHELKTPLIPIKSQVQLWLSEDYGSLNVDQRESLSMIARNEKRLEDLLTDVVDITKIRSGKLELFKELADLADIVTTTVLDMKSFAHQRGVDLQLKLEADLPDFVFDPKRVKQVMNNLVDNALKFTKKGGEVVVTVTSEEDKVIVSVVDTGIGMSKGTLKKAFTPFYQAESAATRKYEGTGLGLIISKSFIEAHEGDN